MSIFISYRRDDSSGHAGRLRDHLRARFGAQVFQDVDGIADGEVFENVLENALNSSQVAIVIIGRTWLTCTNQQGERRLDDPKDWVRTEVRMLLQRNIRVIPVLVGGATLPRAEDLPEDLRPLAKRQSRELRDTSWDADVHAFLDRLEEIVKPGGEKRAVAVDGAPSKSRRWLLLGAVAAIVVLAGLWLTIRPSGNDPIDNVAAVDGGADVSGTRPAPPALSPSAPVPAAPAPTGATASSSPEDPAIASARAIGLLGKWRMDDFSGLEPEKGAATTFEMKVQNGGVFLVPLDGNDPKDIMKVRQIQERAVTLVPESRDGNSPTWMYQFDLSADGSTLADCHTITIKDFHNEGPCQWKYERATRTSTASALPDAIAKIKCGSGPLPDEIDPACVAAAKSIGLVGEWRSDKAGASYRFHEDGKAIRLTPADGKWDDGRKLSLRSIENGTVTLAWPGFVSVPDSLYSQEWFEYDITPDQQRLVKCRQVASYATRSERNECREVPQFLVRASK